MSGQVIVRFEEEAEDEEGDRDEDNIEEEK